MSGSEINVISRTQIIVVEPTSGSLSITNAGPAGPSGSAGVVNSSQQVALLTPNGTASAAASNNGASTFTAVSDPSFRSMLDLRNLTKVRIMGRIGGALVAATTIRIQYHTGGNPAVATGDGGWTTLCTTAGSHTLNTMFYSAELTVPAGAQINNCLIRCGIFGGDGAADPTITACVLNIYS